VSVFFVIGLMFVLVMMNNVLGPGSACCPLCGGRTKHEADCPENK
jgi:transposase